MEKMEKIITKTRDGRYEVKFGTKPKSPFVSSFDAHIIVMCDTLKQAEKLTYKDFDF